MDELRLRKVESITRTVPVVDLEVSGASTPLASAGPGSTTNIVSEPTLAEHDDFKLPPLPSLIIVLMSNLLMQLTFFIIVSSSNEYAVHLGGTATFSGLVIGIPTAVSMIMLFPLSRVDEGVYNTPLHFCCASQVVGNILYALAYRANFLYLILIGRMVCGCGFTFWMYAKKYCSDSRIVGIRRRTTLAGWQVLGQGVGFSLGPFAGGLLSKISFKNSVFNGYTSPAWIMAAMWALFWVAVWLWFEDAPKTPFSSRPAQEAINMTAMDASSDANASQPSSSTIVINEPAPVYHSPRHEMSWQQWGVSATMCWFAMTCFFILGAWESNIPVFTSSDAPANPFHFSPFAAGNMIALGGVCALPFLLLNLFYARRVQDRHTLALGTCVGLAGLLTMLSIVRARAVSFGSLFAAWFLVALGFNVATTVTLSLLSKQLPGEWNGRVSVFIQCSNYTGRVTGAVWGGAGVKVGMMAYVGFQIAIVGIGAVMFLTLWRNMKAKTG